MPRSHTMYLRKNLLKKINKESQRSMHKIEIIFLTVQNNDIFIFSVVTVFKTYAKT